MKWNMATLIWTCQSLSGTFKFYPSHCNKQFFRCYRPSLTKSNFFVHSTHHKFYYGNFGYLGLDFRLKIRKLWLKRWFCTVCQEYVLLCVTWKTKEVLVQNWLLKMLNFFFNVISICHEGPRKKYHYNMGSLLQGKQPQYRLKCHTQLVCDIFEVV